MSTIKINIQGNRRKQKMENTIKTFLIMMIVVVMTGSLEALTIVKGGQSKSVIVLAKTPTRSAQIAAKELQTHIKAISGAVIPIIRENKKIPANSVPIYVGESKKTRKMGLSNNDFVLQESMIKVTDKYIVFIGHDDPDFRQITYEQTGAWPGFNHLRPFYRLGTLYAVYNFLEEFCGIRWYMVTDLGTVIPRRKTLILKSIEKRSKPWTLYRNTSRNHWQIPGEISSKNKKMTSCSRKDNNLFLLRCRLGGEPYNVSHSVADYDKRFRKDHPDWFAKIKPGNHKYFQPRFDNPEVIKHIVKDADNFFKLPYTKRKFGAKISQGASVSAGNYFSVCPLDNRYFGKNLNPPAQPKRKGKHGGNGVYSNYYFSAVNKVAAIVRKKYPEKWISSIAYAGMFEPPEFKLEQNVAVTVCMTNGWQEGSHGMRTLKDWRKKSKRIFTWEYYLEGLDVFPKIRPHEIAEYLLKLEDMKISGWFSEMPSKYGKGIHRNPGLYHLNAYITFLMLRKKDVDINQVLNEYYSLFYGPAAKPMAEFWKSLEGMYKLVKKERRHSRRIKSSQVIWNKIVSIKKLEELSLLINQAERVAINALYATRIKLIKKCILGELEKRRFAYLSTQNGIPRTNNPVITTAPVIDGKMRTAEWKDAVVLKLLSGKISDNEKSSIYLMHDDNFLYIGCKRIKAKENKGKNPIKQWFTLFLDPGRTRRNIFSFSITRDGIFDDKKGAMAIKYNNMHSIEKPIRMDSKWSSKTKHAVSTGKKEWSAEFAITLKTLGCNRVDKNSLWGANFIYSAKINNLIQTAQWATSKGSYKDPDNFGIMTFGDYQWQSICFNFEDKVSNPVKGLDENGNVVLTGDLKGKWTAGHRVPGKQGFAYLFGGPEGKRYIQLLPKIGKDNFTVSFWMKAARQAKSAHLVFSTTYSPYWGISLVPLGKNEKYRLKFAFNAGWKTHCLGSKTLLPDKWYFITYTINRGRDIRLYINGDLKSICKNIYLHTKPLKNFITIGGPYNNFKGLIDSFTVYRGDLSATQIKDLYNQHNKGKTKDGKYSQD